MAILLSVNEFARDLPRQDLYRLVASVRFLTGSEGGRKTPIASDYRPDCWFGLFEGGERVLHGCVFFFRDGGDAYEDDDSLWVRPGGTCVADVLVRAPRSLRGVAERGRQFDAQEGTRVVAQGVVLDVFDPGPDRDL